MSNLFPEIESHLKTSNIYVQRNIINNNIAKLKKWRNQAHILKTSSYYLNLYRSYMASQVNYRKNINKKIARVEQESFRFGNPISKID